MFIKKLNRQNENLDIDEIEGIINFDSDIELRMVLVDDIQNIYRNIYDSNERISKKVLFKPGNYEIMVYSHYDFVLDEDIDKMNKCKSINELIEVVKDTCNILYLQDIIVR